MIIRRFADYQTLSSEAARTIAAQISAKPATILGLAAGKTPLGTYSELVRMHREDGLDFSRVAFFNLDEYEGLPADHPDSFTRFLKDNLLQHINATKSNVHLLRSPSGSDVESYCHSIEELIRNAGGIDLQILGIGLNGHIAFNEPGSRFDSRTRVVTLAASDASNTLRKAITMGIATILDARRILLLSSGASKSDMLATAIQGPVTEAVPASVLQRHPDVLVLTDSGGYSTDFKS